METSGTRLAVATRADDLRALAEHDGPVATVYLTTAGDVENAAQGNVRRWRAVRDDLARQGAPDDLLAAVDPLVSPAHLYGAGLAIVAAAGEVLHVEHLDEAPASDFGAYEPLPVLAPLFRARQESVAHVIVRADRGGADIVAVGRDRALHTGTVDTGDAARKSAPGGWSQRRYQTRAENAWESNARVTADAVVAAADEVRAEVVVVGGDVRAVELLEKRLPDRYAERVEEIDGEKTLDEIEAEGTRWVRNEAARQTVVVLEKFREELGQHDRATEGVDATLAALSAAQVDVLLVSDDLRDERRACFGSDAVPVSADASALRELGIDNGIEGRLVDVAIRAALGSGAGVRIVPRAGGPAEGIGAVLRWS